jgi:esterase/lipase superfamily enzyme
MAYLVKTLIAAHAERTDIVEAIDKAIGWERFISSVTKAESVISDNPCPPWLQSSRPNDADAEVWRKRTAFLDAIVYE